MTLKSGTALIGVLSGQCLIFDAAADPPPPGYNPAPPSPSSHSPDLSAVLNKPNGPALRFKKEDFVPVPDMAPIQLDDPKIERRPAPASPPLKVTIPNIQEARQPEQVRQQPMPAQAAAAPPEGKGFFGRLLSRLDSVEESAANPATASAAVQPAPQPAAQAATQMQKRGTFNRRDYYTSAPMPAGTNQSVPYLGVVSQDLPPPPKPQAPVLQQLAQETTPPATAASAPPTPHTEPAPLAKSPTPVITREVVHLTPDAVPPNRSIIPKVDLANRQNPFSELAPAAGEVATSPAAATAPANSNGAPLITLSDIPPEPATAKKPAAPLPPVNVPSANAQTSEPLIALPGMEAPKPKPPAAIASKPSAPPAATAPATTVATPAPQPPPQAAAPPAAVAQASTPANITPPPASVTAAPTPAATPPASVAQTPAIAAPAPAASTPQSVAQAAPPPAKPDPKPANPTPAEPQTAQTLPAEPKSAQTAASTPLPPPRALSSPLWEEQKNAKAPAPETPKAKPQADTTALAQRPRPAPTPPSEYGSSARAPQPTIASKPIGPARLPANVPSDAIQHWQGPDVIDARNVQQLPPEVLPPATSTPVQQPLPWEEPAYAQAPAPMPQEPQAAPPPVQQQPSATYAQQPSAAPFAPALPQQPEPAQARPIPMPALPVQPQPPATYAQQPAPAAQTMQPADPSEPKRMLSEESRQMVRNLNMEQPAPRSSAKPVLIERARDLSALDQKPQPASAEGQVGHESLGVKIEIKPPRMNFDYELEKAYNALIAGQSNIAIEIYKRVLDNDANNKNALFGLATTYHRAGQIDLARPVYSRLLTVDPGNSDGLNNFLVLLSDEAPEEALGELMRLSERNPQYSALPAQIAVIFQKMGQYDKAAQYMFQAIGMAPENITYRYNFAIMLDKQGKYDEAAKLYRQLIQAYQRGEALPGSIQKIQQRLTFISSNRPS